MTYISKHVLVESKLFSLESNNDLRWINTRIYQRATTDKRFCITADLKSNIFTQWQFMCSAETLKWPYMYAWNNPWF